MIGLTYAQRRTLLAVQDFIDRNSRAPSYREIAAELGLASRSGAYDLVRELERRGHVIVSRHGIMVVRRIEAVKEWYVWDTASESLVPYVPSRFQSLKRGVT